MQPTPKQVWTMFATMLIIAAVSVFSYKLGALQYTNIVTALIIGGVWVYALFKRNAAMCLGIGIFYFLCMLNDKVASVVFRPFMGDGIIAQLMIIPIIYTISVLPLIRWMRLSVKDRQTPLKPKVRAKDIGIMLGTMVLLGAMSFFVSKTAVMYDGMSWYNMQQGKLYPSGLEMQMTGVACLAVVFALCLFACMKRVDFILLGVFLYHLYTGFLYSLPSLLAAGMPSAIPVYPYTYLLSASLDQADMVLAFFYLLSVVPLLVFVFNRMRTI